MRDELNRHGSEGLVGGIRILGEFMAPSCIVARQTLEHRRMNAPYKRVWWESPGNSMTVRRSEVRSAWIFRCSLAASGMVAELPWFLHPSFPHLRRYLQYSVEAVNQLPHLTSCHWESVGSPIEIPKP
jgi:hypothetical protein